MRKKLCALFLALALCFSLGVTAYAEDSWTILVYLCGADLESDAGLASMNMQQMVDAATGTNVRFVVQTGGAENWENGASADRLERYLITGGGQYLVDSQPDASMGDANTLEAFLKWAIQEYPATRMGLVFWDHGSGSINGVCFDEKNDSDSLLLRDIDRALCSVDQLLPGGFEFIGFDACLMGTVETAAVLASHAKYMIGSQETEPGAGWDYTSIGRYLDSWPTADGLSLGKIICDSYYAQCAESEQEDSATLSVIDLGRIAALRAAFDAYAKDLYDLTEKNADFAEIARAVAQADNFGGNNRNEGYTNMVDLGGLIAAGTPWSSHAEAAAGALSDAVMYKICGSNHPNASGLALYYPLRVQGSMELGIFKDICISAYYLGFVDKIAYGSANGSMDNYDNEDLVNGYQDTWSGDDYGDDGYSYDDSSWGYLNSAEDGVSSLIAFAEGPGFDENGIYGFTLTEDSLYNTESVEAVVYLLSEDKEDYICLGYTGDVIADWNTGTFEDNFDGYWFSLPDGQNLCVYLVEEYSDYALFTSPVKVNGEETNLRFTWDYVSGAVNVVDLWDGIGDNGIAARPGRSLAQGDVIIPCYDAIAVDSGDPVSYVGEEFVWGGGDELTFDIISDGSYLYAFSINDVYGGYYVTDFVDFEVANGEISLGEGYAAAA